MKWALLLLAALSFGSSTMTLASELFLVDSSEKSTSVMTIETKKPVSDTETAVIFRVLSVVRLSKNNGTQLELVTTRSLLSVVCNNERKSVGDGGIILKHAFSLQTTMSEKIQQQTFNPPQKLESSFKAGHEAAEIACMSVMTL